MIWSEEYSIWNSCIWTAKYTNFIYSSDHTICNKLQGRCCWNYFLNPKRFTLSYKLKSIKKNYRAGEEPLKLTFNLQGVDLKQEDIMDTNHTTEVWLMVLLFLLLVTQADGHHELYWSTTNRQCYSCVISCLAFEWKWGWYWPCFDRNLGNCFYYGKCY